MSYSSACTFSHFHRKKRRTDIHSAQKQQLKVVSLPATKISTKSSAQPRINSAKSLEFSHQKTSGLDAHLYSKKDFIKKFFTIDVGTLHCKICNKTGTRSSTEYHLVNYHAVQLPYKCLFCSKRFTEKKDRKKHLLSFHNGGYNCKFCKHKFMQHDELSFHTNDYHNSNDTEEKSSVDEIDLSIDEMWYTTHPQRRPFRSSQNKGENSSSVPKTNHIERNDDATKVYTFDEFRENFFIGVSEIHQKCVPCDKVIEKSSMLKHIRNCHSMKSSYFCELCPESFTNYAHRRRHMKKIHTKDFRCEFCDKQFHHSVRYKEHMDMNHTECVDIPTLKSLDEVDIPLEKIQFIEKSKRNHVS